MTGLKRIDCQAEGWPGPFVCLDCKETTERATAFCPGCGGEVGLVHFGVSRSRRRKGVKVRPRNGRLTDIYLLTDILKDGQWMVSHRIFRIGDRPGFARRLMSFVLDFNFGHEWSWDGTAASKAGVRRHWRLAVLSEAEVSSMPVASSGIATEGV